MFVVAVAGRGVRDPNTAVDLQVGLVADERADVHCVVGRREPSQLAEVHLLLERGGEAAVICRARSLGIGLRTRRESRESSVVNVDVVRAEDLVGRFDVRKKRQLAWDDWAAQ